MPRKIDPTIREKLDSKDWLVDMHVNQLFSIVEIGRLLPCTPAVVTKALREFNIVSPPQQELRTASNIRKYGVANPGAMPGSREKALSTMTTKYGGHNLSAGNRDQRDATCLSRYGTTSPSQNKQIAEKISKTKLGATHDLLTDLQWIEREYYFNNKSINQISTELNVAYPTVVHYFRTLGIETKRSSLPRTVLQNLTSITWLKEQHYTLRKSLSDIALDLDVADSTVFRYFSKHDLDIELHSRLSNETFAKLNDKNWLENQYITLKKTFSQISREVGCSSCTVAEYVKSHGIKYQNYHHKISNVQYLKLHDPNWLTYEHQTLQKPLVQIATELGFCSNSPTNSGILTKYFRKFNLPVYQHRHSYAEKEIVEFIKSIGMLDFVENTKSVISPLELDIYIPSKNLAIEYCGLYWHSDKHKHDRYHLDKKNACNNKSITLLTIFEDEWIDRKPIVKSKLRLMLGYDDTKSVYARNCVINVVSSEIKKQFFDTHHIQGNGPSSIDLGLYHCNKLVACIGFSKKEQDQYYLSRYATSERVPGGFSKLLKHFRENYSWTEIVTFADLRWSEGKLYEKTGFVLDKQLPPDYQYVVKGKRIHKFNFRHKHLEARLGEKYDPTLSEAENTKQAGIPRSWNCGLKRYVLTNST